MNDVVNVASQSPPKVTTSTKQTAQAVSSTDQESFDLILKKASETFQKEKSDDAHKTGDTEVCQKQTQVSSSEKVCMKNGKKEVSQNKEKVKENEKDIEVNDEVAQDEVSEITTAFVETAVLQQPVMVSTETVEVTESGMEVITPVQGQVAVTDSMQPVFQEKSANASSSNESDPKISEKIVEPKIETDKNMKSTDGSAIHVSGSEGNLNDVEKIELPVDRKVVQVSENKANTLESKNIPSEGQTEENGQNSISTVKNSFTKEVEIKPQDTVQVQASQPRNEEKMVVSQSDSQKTKSEAAPPDSPPVTESINKVSQATTSQSEEPARLAEAPKNEVITQIGTQIDQMVKTNRSTVRMQLYPEELGHINIKIVTTHAGVGITMVADNPATQEILKTDMNSLKQNMQEAGVQISDLNIGQGQNSSKQQTYEEKHSFGEEEKHRVSRSSTSSLTSDEKMVRLRTTAIDYRV